MIKLKGSPFFNYLNGVVMLKRLAQLLFIFFIFKSALAKDIEMNAEFIGSYCTEYFGLVSVEFSNNTGNWVKIKSIKTSFGNSIIDDNVSVVTGENLKSWDSAIYNKLRNDAFYSQLLLGSIAILGATSNNKSGKKLGLGAVSALSISELSKRKDRINLGEVVPSSHLFAGAFTVPPGMSVSKWILFGTESNKTTPYINNLFINASLNNGKKLQADINLRGEMGGDGGCSWQSRIQPDDLDQ